MENTNRPSLSTDFTPANGLSKWRKPMELAMPDDLIARVDALAEKATKGELRIREMGRDFFVERPKQLGEAYGVEILGDDSYPTKRGDAELIVALVNAWPQLRELALAGMAARWIPVSERLPDISNPVVYFPSGVFGE